MVNMQKLPPSCVLWTWAQVIISVSISHSIRSLIFAGEIIIIMWVTKTESEWVNNRNPLLRATKLGEG